MCKINCHEYEYLSGNWRGVRGAAYNVVAEWCQNHGYGDYGQPTVRGKKAMEEYEREHKL